MPVKNTHYLDVDIKLTNHISVPRVTQNDDVFFIVRILDDGRPVPLTNVQTFLLASLKPNKETILTVGTVSEDEISFKIESAALNVKGRVQASVQLYYTDGRTSTIPFYYEVIADSSVDYIPDKSETSLIQLVLGDAPFVLEAAQAATVDAEEATAYADNVRINTEAERLATEAVRLATLDSKDAAEEATATANTSAENADAMATAAEAAAALATREADDARVQKEIVEQVIADGPVASVNGQTGMVTGLATEESVNEVTVKLAEEAQEIEALKTDKASKSEVQDLVVNKAEKVYVDTLLAEKATKGEITANDLNTSTNAGRIQPINLSDEVKQMMAGTTPINAIVENKGVTTEKGANGFIVDAHFSQSPIYSAGNKNLFDESTAINGQSVSFSTGVVSASPNDFVSDFIAIKPNTSYTVNKQGQLAFYDASRSYISGSGNTNPLYQPLTIVSPPNAYYVRVSNPLSNKGSYQFEIGSTVTPYEVHYKGGRLHNKSVKKGVIADAVIVEKNIERRTLADEALKYLPVETTRGKNLFNRNKITADIYIRFDTGTEINNASYNATDFILIEPNTEYAIYKKDQLSFYDENFNFISGIGGAVDYLVLTTPLNAKYVRMSIADANLNLVQIEKGNVSTGLELHKDRVKIEELVGAQVDYNLLFKHLHNPFQKTKIKLVGDSLTAGVGGTGYSLTGPLMFKDYRNVDRYENIPTATCWASSLKNFLEAKYNRETFVDLEDKGFEVIERNAVQTLNANSYNFYFYDFPNQQAGKPMAKFKFYGDHFSMYHHTHSALGIFEVVVDGVVVKTIDGYAATAVFNAETVITGLTVGEHLVELRSTKTKNVASTGFNVRISGLKLPKSVEVRNWGISGIRTLDAYFDRTKLIESTDDIVFIQLGTNDRIPDASIPKTTPSRSRKLLEVVVNRAKEVGADVYLMAAPPASVASETSPVRAFHMEDVHNYIKRLADEQKLPFISHFQEFYEVMRYKGVTLDSLLADGLHPNDIGYDMMFKEIMQKTGISLTYEGVPIE